MTQTRWQRTGRLLLRAFAYTAAIAILLLALAVLWIRTGWANDQIRMLLLSQANQYLDATLDIERIEGSLFGGVRFVNVRLSRDGKEMVAIDELRVSYRLREILGDAVTIQRLTLSRPRITLAKEPDGRWNLATLIRRETTAQPGGRPLSLPAIEVDGGTVEIGEMLTFGPARLPTSFTGLDITLEVAYESPAWHVSIEETSWIGTAPDLTVTRMSGGLSVEPSGWTFEDFAVETPSSAFVLDGRVVRERQPTVLDLAVHADRFAFQEWAGVVPGLADIAVDGSFDTTLVGPASQLRTEVNLASNGGAIAGAFVLDNRVPGWHGRGAVTLERFDLARWLNRPDQASDITGRVDFDMDLQLGRGFPRTEGSYDFDGGQVTALGYRAARLRARGTTKASGVVIDTATAVAYGARIQISAGSVGFEAPFPFRFAGAAQGVDLRRVPGSVPLPHVESRLAFAYDVSGRFRDPVLTGQARFEPSVFLGATIGAGAVGTIDTSVQPFRYEGEGDIADVSLARFGTDLDVTWMRAPEYAGTFAGHFQVEGAGGDGVTRVIRATGRLDRADLFDGVFSDADVAIQIEHGSLSASYDGRFAGVNPAVPLRDARLDASLTGSGRVAIAVSDLLVRNPALDDYDIEGTVALEASTVRNLTLDRSRLTGHLAGGTLTVTSAEFSGPILDATGYGTIELDGRRPSRFNYDVTRGDLSLIAELSGRSVSGQVVGSGQLSGPLDEPRLVGQARFVSLELPDLTTLNVAGDYDLTVPTADLTRLSGRATAEAATLRTFGRDLREVMVGARLFGGALTADVWFSLTDGPRTFVHAAGIVHDDRRGLDLSALDLSVLDAEWQMKPATPPPALTWNESAVEISGLEFEHGGAERISISGTWRPEGGGALRVSATDVFLDTFTGVVEEPSPYGGLVTLDAIVGGTRTSPSVAARVLVSNGRVRRLPYERLAGRVDYADGVATVDLRLDQQQGVWITAAGAVPLARFDGGRPEQSMRVALTSSPIDLGLLEGVTDVVQGVSGQVQFDVVAVGTSDDPHFIGSVKVLDAAFQVAATGARYRRGTAAVLLDRDRVTVDGFRIEDALGRTLEVRGSIGTHEMKVGDIAIEAVAQQFEVLNNEFGRVDVDATVSITGQFESPRISGDVTVTGGELQVDAILDRVLFAPYATSALPDTAVDALLALNPWERLGLGIFLHVPGTLRLLGENLQVSEGTPLGLGSFNLRAAGDPYLYKDPAQPMYVTGSLDQVTGTYAFQGRRFDLSPESSINFRGDLSPEVWIRVTRVISEVETSVTILGSLREPELRLASIPPLAPSDILSLIVFNTAANQLSALQQQELAIRAGTLAAGFLAAPLISALERSIGIDTLEIDTGSVGRDLRVTIGDEIAPGLVARFSRQFGDNQYDEAQVEYYLSRIFRIRATFSDAGTLVARSPFRRVERAGIDLLLFFSF